MEDFPESPAEENAAEDLPPEWEKDEKRRAELTEAYGNAGEIILEGLPRDSSERGVFDLGLGGERCALEPPILETSTVQDVSIECPRLEQADRYMDKVEALMLGTTLLVGYGISCATQAFSRGRQECGENIKSGEETRVRSHK